MPVQLYAEQEHSNADGKTFSSKQGDMPSWKWSTGIGPSKRLSGSIRT